MGLYVNPGNINFSRAIRSEIYVDKTGMLEYLNSVIDTEQQYICVSRPRRFGKTIAARMAVAYYSKGCDSKELFADYEIAKAEDFETHLNQYNVIHLDIGYLRSKVKNAAEVVPYLQNSVISELRKSFPGSIDENVTLLPDALEQVYLKNGERFMIIIDEWDTLFREDKYDTEAQDAYVWLLRGLFKGEQSQNFIQLAYLTGILPIKKYNSESALNNFDEFTMTHPEPLTSYVGFTEDEVKVLCDEYNMDFSEAQRWYDGYAFGGMKHIYSPNSVVKAMRKRRFNSYWTATGAYELLQYYIDMDYDGLKTSVVQMLTGEHCPVDVEIFENDMVNIKGRDDVLTVLIHLGYLGYDSHLKEAYIPNEEVRSAFVRAIKGTDWTPVIQAIQNSDALLHATWNCDADTVARRIDEVHMANTSILEYNDENALSCVMMLAYYNAVNEYIIMRELPAGKGYADLVFLPKKSSDKPAMIIELKYDQSERGAIDQIKQKQYVKALEKYQGNILMVGINYDKKTKVHSCVIEKWEK